MGCIGVPGTGFWNGASALKQYFVLPKNGSKYYLKYTFFAFPVLGILGLVTPLDGRIPIPSVDKLPPLLECFEVSRT